MNIRLLDYVRWIILLSVFHSREFIFAFIHIRCFVCAQITHNRIKRAEKFLIAISPQIPTLIKKKKLFIFFFQMQKQKNVICANFSILFQMSQK